MKTVLSTIPISALSSTRSSIVPRAQRIFVAAAFAICAAGFSRANAQSALPSFAVNPAAVAAATSSASPKIQKKVAAVPSNDAAKNATNASPLPSLNEPVSPVASTSSIAVAPSVAAAPPARGAASVAGIGVQGLSDAQALQVLERELAPRLDETVSLSDSYAAWTTTRRKLGAQIPYAILLREARASHDEVALRFVVDRKQARATLQSLAPKINRVIAAPADGVLQPDEDTPRRPQRATLAIEGSILRVARAIESDAAQNRVEIVVSFSPFTPQTTPPKTAPPSTPTPTIKPIKNAPPTTSTRNGKSLYKDAPVLLAAFSTPYDSKIEGRTENLRLAAKFMNGSLVKSGRVFSTNLAIGERRASQGWKEAKMFLGGRVVTGMASGICQSSTTIYNAALLAGLPIVERHPHSFRVSYAPASRDAAIYWGAKDMKFRNNTGGPIRVRTYLRGERFHVELYGTKAVTQEIEISSRVLSRKNGVRSEAFRTVRLDGKSMTEKLSRDYYLPHP